MSKQSITPWEEIPKLEAQINSLRKALELYGDASGLRKRPLAFIQKLAKCGEETPGRDLALAEIVARAALDKEK